MDTIKVIFLCRGNSARSQMSEAILKKYGGDRFEAHSAGLEPTQIHPLTRQVMEEAGYDLTGQFAKGLDEYLGKDRFNYVIFVCSKSKQDCPAAFPGVSESLSWGFEDPVDFIGSNEDKLAKFREVRNKIEARIKDWLKELDQVVDAD